ncbi:MAG: TolC family protein [Cyclobacteriaceae bacterium]|nr:TolC family protein [Cyclobacteriaceae bacterium]
MRVLILFLILLYITPLRGQGVDSYSLKEAIDYALIHQADILNAVADEERAVAQKNEVRGIGLPQINASFDFRDFVELPTSLIPAEFFGGTPGEFMAVQFGTKYSATASLEASQLLFSGDYVVALQSSGTFIELSKKMTQKTRVDVAVAVAKSYYSILVNEERLKLVSDNLIQLEKLKNETKAGFDAGFIEKIDLDRLTVSFNNLEAELQNLKKVLVLGYAMLKFQMGMDLSGQVILRDTLDENMVRQVDVSADGFEYEDRAEVQLLRTQLELSQQNLKRHKMGYAPNLLAYGSFSSQAQRNEFNFFSNERWYPIGIVGLTMKVPLFDGLQRNYRIQQSKFEIMKLENSMVNINRGIDLELESAKVGLQNSLVVLDNRKANIELARSVFDTAGKKFSAGTGSSMEVIGAETALMEAQANYYNALYAAMIAKIDFEKAKGTILE